MSGTGWLVVCLFLMKHLGFVLFCFVYKMEPFCPLGQLCFTEALEGPGWDQESPSGAIQLFVAFSVVGPQLLPCRKTYGIRLGVVWPVFHLTMSLVTCLVLSRPPTQAE